MYKFNDGKIVEVEHIEKATKIEDMFKINLPSSYEEYECGNGEGVWACGSPETKKAYDDDVEEGIYFVMVLNDSVYYPPLGCYSIIPVEMRGENRAVAIFDELQEKYGRSYRKEAIEAIFENMRRKREGENE